MTLLELRDKANAVLIPFWKELVIRQNAYFEKHGKYFQLLISPENSVVDGEDTIFVVRKREDNVFVADVDFEWSDKIPFRIMVEEFTGAETGFRVAVSVDLSNGERYMRIRDSLGNDTDWFKREPLYPETKLSLIDM